MAPPPRSTQTRIKHLILERYLGAWGRIITYGLRESARRAAAAGHPFTVRFVYVDGFAFCGRYAGDEGELLLEQANDGVWGSPIIGVRALDRLHDFAETQLGGAKVVTNSILVERDPKRFAELLRSLEMAGVGGRAKLTADFDSLSNREISVVHGDVLAQAPAILRFTEHPCFAFYLLDPYGPKGIPMSLVRPVVEQRGTDALINFPYQDMHKKAGYGKPAAENRTEAGRKILENWRAVFGDQGDEWLSLWLRAAEQEDGSDAEQVAIRHYRTRLAEIDASLAVKLIPLRFPDRERTMFYLFLTTKDPTGALVMNRVLYDASLEEYVAREEFMIARIEARVRDGGTFELFPVEEVVAQGPTIEAVRELDLNALGTALVQEFAGQTVRLKDVYRALLDSNVFPEDIGKALTQLKREKRVRYDRARSLRDTITFEASLLPGESE